MRSTSTSSSTEVKKVTKATLTAGVSAKTANATPTTPTAVVKPKLQSKSTVPASKLKSAVPVKVATTASASSKIAALKSNSKATSAEVAPMVPLPDSATDQEKIAAAAAYHDAHRLEFDGPGTTVYESKYETMPCEKCLSRPRNSSVPLVRVISNWCPNSQFQTPDEMRVSVKKLAVEQMDAGFRPRQPLDSVWECNHLINICNQCKKEVDDIYNAPPSEEILAQLSKVSVTVQNSGSQRMCLKCATQPVQTHTPLCDVFRFWSPSPAPGAPTQEALKQASIAKALENPHVPRDGPWDADWEFNYMVPMCKSCAEPIEKSMAAAEA